MPLVRDQSDSRVHFWLWLIGFVAIGFIIRLALIVSLPAIERPDEIYQNLEPAYRLWTGFGIVPWEWRVGIRSWLFPGALSALMFLSSLLHLPTNAAVPLIWAVLAALSCSVIVAGVSFGWRLYGVAGAVLGGIFTSFWPDLIYYGPRTLGEVQAGNFLVIAVALAAGDATRRTPARLALIGALLGTTFDLRFQLSLALLLVACWVARLEFRKSWIPLIFGAAVPIVLLGISDWVTLGSPFQSVWKNIQINFFQHKAEFYGVEPLYFYLQSIISRNGGVAILLSALFFYGIRSAPLFAFTALTVIAFHSLIAHKEVSFVYVSLPCAMVTVGLGAARFVTALQRWLKFPLAQHVNVAIAGIAAVAIAAAVGIAERPYKITPFQNSIRALVGYAHAQPDLCGLDLYTDEGIGWGEMGGQVSLLRNVPIYMTMSSDAFEESRQSFNYVIALKERMRSMPGFDTVYCSRDYCLFHQPVQCQPTSAHEISNELANSNQ